MNDFNNDQNGNENGSYNTSENRNHTSQEEKERMSGNYTQNNYGEQNTPNSYQGQQDNQYNNAYQGQQGNPYNNYGEQLSPQDRDIDKKGLATASMVLGIIGLFTCCCGFFGAIISGLAVVFAIIVSSSNKNNPARNGRGMAKAGLILGIIGLILALGMGILGIVLPMQSPGMIEEFMNQMDIQY